MLKKTIVYEDFDGEPATETLNFNLTRADLIDHLDLMSRLEDIQARFGGESRDLTTSEIKEILDLVKYFMEISYGVRSEDGKRFSKSPEIWKEFTETAVYDAFIMGLFENNVEAVAFMEGILPASLLAEAQAEIAKQAAAAAESIKIVENGDVENIELPAASNETSESLKFEDYSREELLAMSQEDFQALTGSDPIKMTKEQLTIAMERRTLST